ncbi:MAG TPA: hypothetical protein VGL59_25950 [Polyangia bacterium]|jgi:hypothetical protein
MRNGFRLPVIVASVIGALLGWPPRAVRASTSLALGLDDLVARATLVVAATPVRSTAVWEDSSGGRGRRIVTYTQMRVEQVIDGSAPAELWIRTLGGSIGDIGQRVDGEAVLALGRPCLFFLRRFPDGPHGVVGMAQGQFPLDGASVGPTSRLHRFPVLPRLERPPAGASLSIAPTLEGKTLEQAARLIHAARVDHAP